MERLIKSGEREYALLRRKTPTTPSLMLAISFLAESSSDVIYFAFSYSTLEQDQRSAVKPFQHSQLLAERRLRNVHTVSCRRNAAGIDDSQKILVCIDIH